MTARLVRTTPPQGVVPEIVPSAMAATAASTSGFMPRR
jgi:hypothetical protein